VQPRRRRTARFVTNLSFSKRTRRLVCASSAPTGFCGSCSRDVARLVPESAHRSCPGTVIAWHRRAFAWYWTRESRRRPGRPNVAAEIHDLIRHMSEANPRCGSTPHSGGTGQVGNRSSTIDRGQIWPNIFAARDRPDYDHAPAVADGAFPEGKTRKSLVAVAINLFCSLGRNGFFKPYRS